MRRLIVFNVGVAQVTLYSRAFTLLEMMIVLAIVSVLMLAMIPANTGRIDQAYIAETIDLVRKYQPVISKYFDVHQEFPADNQAAGLPEAKTILGNYLTSVLVEDGAMHLTLGNKIRPELSGKVISLRPIFVPNTVNTPVSWVCANDSIPANMLAAGENRSNVPLASLPLSCR